jgi:outer membrane protein assembly factor BamB
MSGRLIAAASALIAVSIWAVATGGPAALASAGAAAGGRPADGGIDWTTYGFDTQRSGDNPSESVITVANASQLHQVWSVDLGAVMIAQPVEAAGLTVGDQVLNVIYEGTEHGDVDAIDAATGQIIWSRNLGSVTSKCDGTPDGVFGVGGTPFIDRPNGLLYVAGGDGALHALDLATGAEAPGWPMTHLFPPTHEHVYGGLESVGGLLYVTTAGVCDESTPYHGRLIEIDVTSRSVLNTFFPAGQRVNGGGIWGPGGASADPATGDVFVATGNALHTPQWYLYAEHVVQLSADLEVLGSNAPKVKGHDADFGSTPLVFTAPGCPEQVAAENKYGVLVVYRVGDLTSGPSQKLQIAALKDWRFIGMPAYSAATNMVYVANSSNSNAYQHGLLAFSVQSDCTLALAWHQVIGGNNSIPSPPTVAGDVVYDGDGPSNTEFAFDAETGAVLWNSGSSITGRAVVAPAVVNGQVLVPAWDHMLHAYAP